jgi:tetratricopeptide (TPR) repeat protein
VADEGCPFLYRSIAIDGLRYFQTKLTDRLPAHRRPVLSNAARYTRIWERDDAAWHALSSCAMRALFVLCLLATVAHAAPVDPETRAEAKREYENGRLKFDLGKFDEAVESFQRAYELVDDPIILYNIGQSYRLGQNHSRALLFYKSYLRRRPDAPNRTEVERRITELTELLEEQKKHETEVHPEPRPEPKPKPQLEPKPEPRPEPASHRRTLIGVGAGLGGLGVVSLAIGGAMLGLAGSASDRVERAALTGMEFTAALRDTEVSGRRFNAAGISLLAIGGASTVAAAITLGIAFRHPANRSRAEH